ncbi:MAG: hypothetical protein OXE44_18175 [Nitrospinae bacterium]|nr:hypothetical protein [Nitrospinota bacterium]
MPGCGGGGGGGGSAVIPRTPSVIPSSVIPLQAPVHARQAPIIEYSDTVHVGAGVRPEANQLASVRQDGDTVISSGHVRDGAGREAVVAFLDQFIENFSQFFDSEPSLQTWASPPVVRVAEGTTPRQTDYAVQAVQIINAYLPRENRLRFSGVPSPPGVGTFEVSEGDIFIDFAPHSRWNPPSRLVYRGVARPAPVSTAEFEGGPITFLEMHSARIWINEDRLGNFTHEANILLLAHELLHALGLRPGHPDYDIYHDSIMRSRVPRSYSDRILGPVDHDAIQAIYAAYEPGETDVHSLGAWSDTSFHVRGDIGDIAFGAASRNGLVQPWARGPKPENDLADNQSLSGNVSWSGRLLGMTSGSEPLGGHTRLSINIGTLRGQIGFTGLEYIDSGATWNDGDLSYSVIVRKNTFNQTGGDAGEVTGAFFGPNHEGMGGVVERSDMSAGFGGTR